MKKKSALLFFLVLLLASFKGERGDITIFMVGDSTMANKSLKGNNPERGWGQMFPGFLCGDIKVDNHARNGRSSKSFIGEGLWDAVVSKIKEGDYVFIQFGHNDEKPDEARHTDPGTTFDATLKRYVDETRAKGGIPVLFNSIVRRNFDTTGNLVDTHGAYRDAPRNVAKELNVAFIDMNQITHDLLQNKGMEPSKELFMWVKPDAVPAIPEGREDNTHLNVYGGRVIAGLAAEAITKAIPGLAEYICKYDYVVAKDGSGDFFTVQEAIDAVPDFRKNIRTTIRIREGVYKEKIVIPESKMNISLIGEDRVKLTYDDYASKPNALGESVGTSGSAGCYVYGPDFYAENITFENSSGPVGQAVACLISGDRAYFKKCRFLGFQDTLYTYGKESRQYYEDCYIEGTVDFIFGSSTAVFNHCTIHSKRDGYITAPSTGESKAYGYVFYDCNLTADNGVNKVFLSRPWRSYARAVFIRCIMGKQIVPEGWNNWGKKEAEKTVFYAEYQSGGEGANPQARAKFSYQLDNLKGYEIESVLQGSDGWNPVQNGNKLTIVAR